MTERFTRGPWDLKIEWGYALIYKIGVCPIAEYRLPVGREDKAIPNAHIIAAAPELYDMLSAVVDAMDNYDMECLYKVDKEDIQNLLAKARGEHV